MSDGRVWVLSAHYIMLIRSQQALPLAKIERQLFIFKYMFETQDTVALFDYSHQGKGKIP